MHTIWESMLDRAMREPMTHANCAKNVQQNHDATTPKEYERSEGHRRDRRPQIYEVGKRAIWKTTGENDPFEKTTKSAARKRTPHERMIDSHLPANEMEYAIAAGAHRACAYEAVPAKTKRSYEPPITPRMNSAGERGRFSS